VALEYQKSRSQPIINPSEVSLKNCLVYLESHRTRWPALKKSLFFCFRQFSTFAYGAFGISIYAHLLESVYSENSRDNKSPFDMTPYFAWQFCRWGNWIILLSRWKKASAIAVTYRYAFWIGTHEGDLRDGLRAIS